MNTYLEDNYLDSILESYFEDDSYLIFESCMLELLAEETKENDKEAEKQEKLENRIKKAHNSIVAKVSANISTNAEKYSSFKFDCHRATKKELVLYIGNNVGASALGGLVGTALGTVVGNAVYGPSLSGTKAGIEGGIAGTKMSCIIVGGATLIEELVKKKMYKELYTTKVYGIKDNGKEKLIGWWLSVKMDKNDLSSDVRKLIK